VEKEIDILQDKERAEGEAAALLVERDAACAQANSTKMSNHALPSNLGLFNCDMSGDANACMNAFNNHEAAIQDQLNSLATFVGDDVQVWNTHSSSCGSLSKEYADKLDLIARLTSTFGAKNTECNLKNQDRNTAFCTFGAAYGSSCSKKVVFENMVADTSVPGNQYSVPDREEEFSTVKTATCHLENYMEGGTEKACSGYVFPSQLKVPVMEKQYSCAETSFIFNGRTWKEPEPSDALSTDYQSSEVSYPLTQDDTFSFCISTQ